jgi:hypothetical protein
MKGLIPKGNICFEYFKNQNHLIFFLYNLRPIIGNVSKRVTALWLEALQSK